jgi:hypothetical protein
MLAIDPISKSATRRLAIPFDLNISTPYLDHASNWRPSPTLLLEFNDDDFTLSNCSDISVVDANLGVQGHRDALAFVIKYRSRFFDVPKNTDQFEITEGDALQGQNGAMELSGSHGLLGHWLSEGVSATSWLVNEGLNEAIHIGHLRQCSARR